LGELELSLAELSGCGLTGLGLLRKEPVVVEAEDDEGLGKSFEVYSGSRWDRRDAGPVLEDGEGGAVRLDLPEGHEGSS